MTQGEFSFSVFLLALLLVLFSCLGNRILMAELVKVKSAFHLFGNAASLECVHLEFSDTALRDFDMGDLLERLKSQMSELFMTEIENSGLVEATAFPLAVACLELVRECINRFDIRHQCIRKDDGQVLLTVNRETIVSVFRIP